MSVRRLGQSPLAVVAVAFLCAAAWTLTFEGSAGPGAAAAEGSGPDPADADPERSAESEADPTGVITRLGPALLAEPDPETLGYDIAIEDRDGHSMDALHEALRRAERGEGQARLVFYGASHVASDLFTGHIREALQERFGDAGHGIVLPAHPWRTYRHRGVEMESNRRRWDSTKVRANTTDLDHFGVHGVFVESDRAGAFGRIRTASRGTIGEAASLFDIYYLARPEGGRFDVVIDGRVTERVSTAASQAGPGYATFRLPDGPHELELRVVGDGMVRFFGVAVERDEPGVLVDTLGINGARARYHLLWEDALYREHLARRRPDLVVLAYGTNESMDDSPVERYEAELREVLGRIRETVPDAACLLVGPSDHPERRSDGTFLDRPRTAQVVSVQHRVAVELGCGFFDLIAFMGGPLSMVEWVAHDPAYGARDHIHYTRRGYQRLGEVLLQALMHGYAPAEADEAASP